MSDARVTPTSPGSAVRAGQDATARDARCAAWATAHAAALRAQDDWMDRNGHPFEDVMLDPFAP